MNGWFIVLGLLVLHVLLVFWLVQTKRLEKWKLGLMLGLVVMIRTQGGKGLIDRIAKPRRFWNILGDFGIWLTLSGMVIISALFLFVVWFSLQPGSGAIPLTASEILVIPGVNPFVPLWYGLVALVVTLVVHEGGHGILARANGIRIKSLGLLYLVVPIGAFVEPDEEDVRSSPRRDRLRVFAAGPLMNFIFAAIALAAFSGAIGQAEPPAGVGIVSIAEDGPAYDAGLRRNDIIASAGGQIVKNWDDLAAILETRSPGDTLSVGTSDKRIFTVTLGASWSAYDEESQEKILKDDPALASKLQSRARLGIGPLVPRDVAFMADPFGTPCPSGRDELGRTEYNAPGYSCLISLPVGEVKSIPYLSKVLPEFYEAPFHAPTFWILTTLAFWIFWINLMVGLTNILPMVPLDGGHIFRDAVGAVVAKLRPNVDIHRRDRIVGMASGAVSIVMLIAFILMIAGPHLIKAIT